MNNLKILFSFLVISIILLQSCSIEKRRYTTGYHLQWNNNKITILPQKNDATIAQIKKENKEIKDTSLSNSNANINSLTASSEKKAILIISSDSIKCDTIIMKDGTEVKAKVLEVTPTEVKYKFCNNISGPLYVAYRYNLSYIKYANGTMDSFMSEHPPLANQPTNRYNVPNNPNNGGTVNGNNNHYPMDNYAMSEYVRKTSLGALICGIVSIFIPYLGVIAAIFAIVLGNKCMKLIRGYPQNLWMYSRRSMTAQIIGWIVLAIYLLVIIALLIALGI